MSFLFTCYIFLKGGASYITNHIYIYIYTHTHPYTHSRTHTPQIKYFFKRYNIFSHMGDGKGIRTKRWHGICSLCIDPSPPKNPRSFPQFPNMWRSVVVILHNSSLYSLWGWWALLLRVCANRRCAEWAPLSVVCDESYSAWLWPEAVIGCVINQNNQWKTRTLKPKTQHIWLSRTPCGKSVCFNCFNQNVSLRKVGS